MSRIGDAALAWARALVGNAKPGASWKYDEMGMKFRLDTENKRLVLERYVRELYSLHWWQMTCDLFEAVGWRVERSPTVQEISREEDAALTRRFHHPPIYKVGGSYVVRFLRRLELFVETPEKMLVAFPPGGFARVRIDGDLPNEVCCTLTKGDQQSPLPADAKARLPKASFEVMIYPEGENPDA